MIGLRDDGFESLRIKLRSMSEYELIRFRKAAREKCLKSNDDRCWQELKFAREEWRSRHPKRRGV
jgi:hypothetical protein